MKLFEQLIFSIINLPLFFLLTCLAFPVCADNRGTPDQREAAPTIAIAESPSNTSTGSFRQLPKKWEKITHEEWLNTLDIDSCETRNQGIESRRKNWVGLDEDSRLLLLTCGFGSYQDAFHVFVIDTEDETINRVVLKTPTKESETQQDKLIRGLLYKSDPEKILSFYIYLQPQGLVDGERCIR